ncbi:MAG: replication initiation factor domain-containing protein [Bacteroidota bacterium]
MSDIPGQTYLPGTEPEDGESGRPRPAREARAARTAPLLPGPPSSNRGGKVTWDTRAISVDWLTVSFPAGSAHVKRVRDLLEHWYGDATETKALAGYRHGLEFANGARLAWSNVSEDDQANDPSCCVQLSGTPLAALDSGARVELCRRLTLGGRVTRIDLALDLHHAERVGLVAVVHEAFQAGQVCKFRVFNVHYGTEQGVPIPETVYLGSPRGDRCVRVYDKGIESQTADRERWERLEVQWRNDAASLVAQDVLGSRDFGTRAFEAVTGAVDFRMRSTGASRELARRAQLVWWCELCEGGVPRALVPKREKRRLDRFTGWLHEAVLPSLVGLARGCGHSYLEVLENLAGAAASVRSSPTTKLLLRDFKRQLQARPFATPF